MNIYKRVSTVAIGLVALISCSSVENGRSKVEKKEEVKVNFRYTEKSNKKETEDIVSNINDTSKLSPLTYYDASNFDVSGLSYLYEGEKIRLNKEIKDGVVLESAYAKNPEITIDKNDERYSKYTSNVEGKIRVEDLSTGEKKITFLDQNAIYVTLRDKNGNTRDIRLNEKVEVLKAPELKDGIRYEELKKGQDNGRVSYQVLTNNGGYEDEKDLPESIQKGKASWKTYFKYDKYKDLDDLSGLKRVEIEDSLGNKYTKNVDFGVSLGDYKGKYEEILTDLDKVTLKYNEDGTSVTGGFNPDLVEKLTNYEEKRSDSKSKLEFVTEILDSDKKSVGRHNIVRKILKDGVEIYSKKEEAYVGFPGTTVAVADSSFYNVSPEVEARMIRLQPKGLNAHKEDKDDKFVDLERPHGEEVIGSMIDEVAAGNSNFVRGVILGQDMNALLKLASERKLEITNEETGATTKYTDDQINNVLKTQYVKFIQSIGLSDELIKDKNEKIVNAILAYDKLKEEIKDLSQEEKDAKLKVYYKELLSNFEDIQLLPELEKLKATDLHFKTIVLEQESGGLKSAEVAKYLPRILEEDKNVKAINMSYGSEASYEEYLAIRDMTDEQKQKAVDAYNDPNNPDFRIAIQTWLADNDFGNLSKYEEYYPGDLYIPSMLNYFRNKKDQKITVTDYQKLLDLRMLTLKQALKSTEELNSANRDILMVRAQGNSLNNSGQTQVDLTHFDEKGRKVVYLDGDKKYNNPFTSIPSYLNEIEKENAEKEGKEYKYNHTYRKNMLGVVGLSHKALNAGSRATDDISDQWGLYTGDSAIYNKIRAYVNYQDSYYERLKADLEAVNKNPNKYPKGYKEELEAQISRIDSYRDMDTDVDGRPYLMSFTRAGAAKLWTVAGEGMTTYVKKLTEEEKKYYDEKQKDYPSYLKFDTIGINPFIAGSSFSAPRITAIAGEIGTKFPWMSAQQIKQTILTTAVDDARMKLDPNTNKRTRLGIYGPDENIGWGIANKELAYRGPGRFVRALTLETGNEDFVADIPYGTYEFSNDIAGAFDPLLYMVTRKALTEQEFSILYTTKDLSIEEIVSPSFKDINTATKNIADSLEKQGISRGAYFLSLYNKVDKYMTSLSPEEKELFDDAGLVKKGKGTLVLSGDNTYKDPTVVEEGTLVFRGSSESPFVVHKDGKLKLDMKYSEYLKNALLDDGEEKYVAKIKADVISRGEVYSYSDADRVEGTYRPLEGSKTYIAAIADLQVDNLDLSETSNFDFNVFRKKNMNVFEKPDFLSEEDDQLKPNEAEEIVNKNLDEKEVLKVSKLAKKNLGKVKLGKTTYTDFIDLIVETKEIKNDNENVSLVAKLVRKNKLAPTSLGNRLRNHILEELKVSNEKEKLNTALNNIDWMDKKELNGEILANSQLLGYDLLEKKNLILKDKLELRGKEGKLGVFTEILNETKLNLNKETDKTILTNGIILGGYYTSKYNTTGISLNYTNSILFDYALGLKDITDPLRSDLSAEERAKEEARRSVKELRGNVYGNNVGLSIYNKTEYNKGYLTGILNIDYLTKRAVSKIGDREVKDYESSDLILNANLEGGYKFNVLKDRLDIEPFVGTSIVSYLKGGFSEDREFGYSSDQEVFTKANASIGLRARGYVDDKINIGGYVSYTKYLTDPLLESKVELKEYGFKDKARGVSLEDNVINYGIDGRYRIKEGYELNLSYKGKNIRSQGISLGIKAEW